MFVSEFFEVVLKFVLLDEEKRDCETLRVISKDDDRWDSGVTAHPAIKLLCPGRS